MGTFTTSPLAEGRELKLDDPSGFTVDVASPLAEGRELKCGVRELPLQCFRVAPRGGA